MCNPMMLFAASTGLQVAGQVSSGNAAKKQADWQAGQMDRQAAEEEDAGIQAADKIRKRTKFERGAAVGTFAASGVRVGDGSAGVVEQYIEQAGEEDALLTLLNAKRRGSSLRDSASMTRAGGKSARNAAYLQGVGSLLSAGNTASKAWPGAWDSGGVTGTNDRGRISFGSAGDWHTKYGRGGD